MEEKNENNYKKFNYKDFRKLYKKVSELSEGDYEFLKVFLKKIICSLDILIMLDIVDIITSLTIYEFCEDEIAKLNKGDC